MKEQDLKTKLDEATAQRDRLRAALEDIKAYSTPSWTIHGRYAHQRACEALATISNDSGGDDKQGRSSEPEGGPRGTAKTGNSPSQCGAEPGNPSSESSASPAVTNLNEQKGGDEVCATNLTACGTAKAIAETTSVESTAAGASNPAATSNPEAAGNRPEATCPFGCTPGNYNDACPTHGSGVPIAEEVAVKSETPGVKEFWNSLPAVWTFDAAKEKVLKLLELAVTIERERNEARRERDMEAKIRRANFDSSAKLLKENTQLREQVARLQAEITEGQVIGMQPTESQKLVRLRGQLAQAQAECTAMRSVLGMVREDYKHEWPSEDAGIKEHRLRRWNQMDEVLAYKAGADLLARLKAAEADTKRLQRLWDFLWSPKCPGIALAIYPYSLASGEKRCSIWTLKKDDFCDGNDELGDGKTIGDAIDAALQTGGEK